jgi:hypothetical protein
LFVPSFASPYAIQNPLGTNSTNATSSGNLQNPTSNGQITVTTDKASYNDGDIIIVSGTTMNYISGQPIVIIIKNPIGDIVRLSEADLGSDRTYSTSFQATGALWSAAGTYTVQAQFGSNANTVQTTFQFTGSSDGINSLPYQQPHPPMPHNPYVEMMHHGNFTGTFYHGMNHTMNPPFQQPLSSPPATPVNSTIVKIPNWVKGVFGFYAEGKLADSDLVQGLQFLIQQGVIQIPTVSNTSTPTNSTSVTIPNWVKGVFGMYAEGKLADNDLVQGLQFLMQKGIIRLS